MVAIVIQIVSLNSSISTRFCSFQLIIGGYNDKQLIYLEKILAKMVNLPIKQDRFDLQIEQVGELVYILFLPSWP